MVNATILSTNSCFGFALKLSRDERPAGSLLPFRVGQSLNPYPTHYRLAFASSSIPYPQPYQLALRLTFSLGYQ